MAETKKQSRPVKATANPQGVRFTYGTPVDLASLGDRLTISNRLAAGKFKLEAHYPAKQFNNKAEYINKRRKAVIVVSMITNLPTLSQELFGMLTECREST